MTDLIPAETVLAEELEDPAFRAEWDRQRLQATIAGALFDFLGRLSSQPAPIRVGSGRGNVQMLELLRAWAAERGLDIDDAEVLTWQGAIAPAAS